jgi:hypothetical protein
MTTATLTEANLADALITSIRQLAESMHDAAERCHQAGRSGDQVRAHEHGDRYHRLRARQLELIERAEAMGIDPFA